MDIKDLKKKITHLIHFNKLQVSYSQEGEDILIDRVLHFKKHGFYVDIGAYHPVKYSNTYKFYLKGWNGINVDAMPGSMSAFKKLRPRDVNLEIPVSDTSELMTYYVFQEQGLNTLSETEANRKNALPGSEIIRTEKLLTRRLDDILSEYIPLHREIDFLSVDAEGFDLKILKSNNWEKFRPMLILAENLSSHDSIEAAINGEMNHYMNSLNFRFFAKTLNTLFFVDNK